MEPVLGDGARALGGRLRRFLLTRNGWWCIALSFFIPVMIAFRVGLHWSMQFGSVGIVLFAVPTLLAIHIFGVIVDRLWR